MSKIIIPAKGLLRVKNTLFLLFLTFGLFFSIQHAKAETIFNYTSEAKSNQTLSSGSTYYYIIDTEQIDYINQFRITSNNSASSSADWVFRQSTSSAPIASGTFLTGTTETNHTLTINASTTATDYLLSITPKTVNVIMRVSNIINDTNGNISNYFHNPKLIYGSSNFYSNGSHLWGIASGTISVDCPICETCVCDDCNEIGYACEPFYSDDLNIVTSCAENYASGSDEVTNVEYRYYHIPFIVWALLLPLLIFFFGRLMLEIIIKLRK